MAERKLNINAPLLSVRRSSATSPSLTEAKKKILEKRHTLPNYKSDSSMDLVTEPVAVPFNWEHIPGKRKGNGGSEPPQRPKEASIAPGPKLPPGKSTIATKKPLEKESKAENQLRFLNKSTSFNVSIVRLDSDKERKDEKRVSNVDGNDGDDDCDDDDIYSDALDKLSFTESFSMNCSASGVSGLDNFDAKKSGTFSTDPQTRDFMMSRFLPAAKAMTLQTPQYASRKQSVQVEQQPREVKKLVREEKKPLLNTHIYEIVPYTGQFQEEESEDEGGDDYRESANISAKGCGLLPRLRIGNSLSLLNPVPGMKMKNQAPLSITNEVSKPSKISHIRSYSPAPAVKKAWDAICKNKSSSRAPSPDKQEVRKRWTSESNRFCYSGELQQPGRLSPFRRAAAAGVSPCRSKPQSPCRGARLFSDSKEAEISQAYKLKFQNNKGHGSIQEVLSQETRKSPTVEKTLYIDTASTVKLSCANSSSLDTKGRIETMTKDLDRIRGKRNLSSIKSSQDRKQQEALEGKGMLNSAVRGPLDAQSPILSNMLALRSQELKPEISQEYPSSQPVQGTADEDLNINNRQIVVVENSGNGGVLPPPLPKSPSESWLWRALPLVSIKNSFLHSNQGNQSHAKRQNSNTTSGNSKWETIVKTSNLHHDHVRYSQELTTHKSHKAQH